MAKNKQFGTVDSAEDQLADFSAQWEACGPWVPEESLSEDGRKFRAFFLRMVNDPRLQGVWSVQGGPLPRVDIQAPSEAVAIALYKQRFSVNNVQPVAKRVA